ncbi:hypothetical protein B0H13DRAFT_1869181 [Mycena leptocephala]|nr:hypothetical protein B0H13DRAFT_1869181 [Mycena leptocephala]
MCDERHLEEIAIPSTVKFEFGLVGGVPQVVIRNPASRGGASFQRHSAYCPFHNSGVHQISLAGVVQQVLNLRRSTCDLIYQLPFRKQLVRVRPKLLRRTFGSILRAHSTPETHLKNVAGGFCSASILSSFDGTVDDVLPPLLPVTRFATDNEVPDEEKFAQDRISMSRKSFVADECDWRMRQAGGMHSYPNWINRTERESLNHIEFQQHLRKRRQQPHRRSISLTTQNILDSDHRGSSNVFQDKDHAQGRYRKSWKPNYTEPSNSARDKDGTIVTPTPGNEYSTKAISDRI